MRSDKFPFRYYLYLFWALVITVIFWLLFFLLLQKGRADSVEIIENRNAANEQITGNKDYFSGDEYNQYRGSLPDEIGKIEQIDSSQIILDPDSGRKKVGNLMNVAIKGEQVDLKRFVLDFFKKFDHNNYQIVYLDTVINRIQVEMKQDKIVSFKSEIKSKLNKYDLLVWDEVLFRSNRSFNDRSLNNKHYSWYLDAINVRSAWTTSIGHPDVIIAVIDNGFDLNHPELKGRSIKPYNVVEKTSNVKPVSENHGTHVASTIIANANNNIGLLGIAPKCSFIPIKVCDNNGLISNSYVIDAILYAIKNNASVINLSIGMEIDPSVEIPVEKQEEYINYYGKDEESFWEELFTYANRRNVTCVIAAGNNNMLTGFDPFQRSNLTIKVGALNQQMEKAKFSNYGTFTNVYAPGVKIYSAKPNGGFEFLDGTSMAAPIVSGSIALLKSKNNRISNKEIMLKLKSTSKLINEYPVINVGKLLE